MARKSKRSKHSKPTQFKAARPKKKVVKHVKEAFSTKWKLAIAGLLAVLAVALYSPSYDYGFVYDDDAVIKDNRYVKEGLDGLGKIWATSYFQGYDENINARAFRPFPLTTLALEVEVWGLDTKVHHTANIIFYGLTAFFLFLFLSKLLREHHPFLAIATCLLFVFHPIHLEVVANIKSRDTMLGFLGLCLSGWLLLKYLDSKKVWPLLLSLLFYFMALFSKEEVITSLATIPLMLWFFRDYKIKKIVAAMLPFLGAVIIFLIYRSDVVGGLNEGITLTYLDNSLLAANGFAERSASNILVLGHYLLKTVFPHPLISDYSYSTIPLVNWDDWRVYAALLANLAFLLLGLHGLVKRKAYGFGPLFYFAAVSIFTSLVITNVSAYNDRFLYIPVLGICFMVAYGFSKMIKRPPKEAPKETPAFFFKNNFIPVSAIVVLCALGVYKIESHLPFWKDRYVLFAHDLNLAPQNARMRKNHGGSLARLAVSNQTDNPELARKYAQQAIEQLDYALNLYNRMGTGHIHLGNMYIILGQYDKAIRSLLDALQLDPNNYFAKSSLGNVYYRQANYQDSINILESIPVHLRKRGDWDLLAKGYDRIGNAAKAAEMRANM